MFTKKIYSALLFAPLFVGCVVTDGDDDDAANDSDTGPSSVGTDDSSGGPSSSVSADTGPSTMTEDTGPATGDETAGTETGPDTGGGGGMFCLPSCEEAADCCAPGTEDMCPGDPPFFNVECVEGLCEFGGCTGDPDCAIIAGTTCHEVSEFPQCVPICTVATEADDCLVEMGETCTGMTDDGMLYCTIEPEPCEDDAACGDFVCNLDTGTCECDGDDDCADLGGVCDLETGFCNCSDDASCGDGFSCVAF